MRSLPSVFLAHTLHYTENVLQIDDHLPGKVLPTHTNLLYHEDEEDRHICIADTYEVTRKKQQEQMRAQAKALAMEYANAGEEPGTPDTNVLVQEILETAEAEAEQIKERAFQMAMADKEQIKLSAQKEAAALLQQAKAEGYAQGLQESQDLLKTQIDTLEKTIAHLEGDLAGFEVELEEQLRWMALEVASRVLNHKVQEDDSILADMVVQTVQGVRNMPWVRIEVAQNMTRLIKRLQDIYDGHEHIEVSAIPAQEDTIQIETPSGRLDASVKTQLDNLRVYFQKNSE